MLQGFSADCNVKGEGPGLLTVLRRVYKWKIKSVLAVKIKFFLS